MSSVFKHRTCVADRKTAPPGGEPLAEEKSLCASYTLVCTGAGVGFWNRDQTFRKPGVIFIMAAKKHVAENYFGSFVLYKGCIHTCLWAHTCILSLRLW